MLQLTKTFRQQAWLNTVSVLRFGIILCVKLITVTLNYPLVVRYLSKAHLSVTASKPLNPPAHILLVKLWVGQIVKGAENALSNGFDCTKLVVIFKKRLPRATKFLNRLWLIVTGNTRVRG